MPYLLILGTVDSLLAEKCKTIVFKLRLYAYKRFCVISLSEIYTCNGLLLLILMHGLLRILFWYFGNLLISHGCLFAK